MNALTPDIIIRPPSLAAVIQKLERNRVLEAKKRRDLISSLRSAASLLNRAPEDVSTDISGLRAALLQVEPARHGISRKRFSNIKADLATAFILTRVLPRPLPRQERSPAWRELLALAEAKHQAWSLSRLVEFCCANGIEPTQVTDATVARFLAHLEATILTKSPTEIIKSMIETWNLLAKKRPGALPLLTQFRSERLIYAPLAQYPETLQAEIKTYLARLMNPSLFDDDAPAKPLRPTSIRNIQAHLRQFLHALVAAGMQPDGFRSLEDLVRPDVVKKGLEHMFTQNGRVIPSGAQNIAATLQAIAKYQVRLPDAELTKLKRYKAKVTHLPVGMTAKNSGRLSQFDDPKQFALLITLPSRVLHRAREKPESRRSATEVMYATAVAILLRFPIRIANLSGLDLERHLTWQTRGRKHLLSIRIEGEEVKNRQVLEIDVALEASKLVRVYIEEFRPLLSDKPGTALFPRLSGGPREPGHFGQAISEFVRRETGLVVNAHLFRHLAGKMFLDANPGEYESVRRFLGHRKLETTTTFYAGFENKAALVRYDETTLSKYKGRKQ